MIQKDFYKEASIAFTGHREIPSEQAGKIPLFLWHGIGL